MKTLTEFLQKCKEVNAKRTEGEWKYDDGNQQIEQYDTRQSIADICTEWQMMSHKTPQFIPEYWDNGEFIAFAANNFGKLVQALEASFKEIKVIRECALQEDAQNTAFKAFDSLCKIERLLLEDLKT